MNQRLYPILILLWCLIFTVGLLTSRPEVAIPPAFTGYGYGGPIHMTMDLDEQGVIKDLQVTQHNETPSYVSKLDTFLHQFIGKPRQTPLILGKDIDAISGATITSEGITTAVRKERAFILKIPEEEQVSSAFSLEYIIIPLLLLITAVIAFTCRHNPLRWAIMIGSAFYLGIVNHTMLSILQLIQISLGSAPAFMQNTLGWMILAIALGSALIIGRIYCGSICPFASIQEIFFQLKIKKMDTTPIINPALDKNSRIIKYILLLTLTGLSLYLHSSASANIEPYITLYAGHATKLAWVFLALMLVLAVFSFRFWCKYLCPVGALTGLVAAFSFFKIRPTSSCTACGDCTRICPTQAITPDRKNIPSIDMAECINCAKCLRVCPVNALKIKGPGHE